MGKLTPWLRSREAGDRNGHGVDRQSPDDEEGENGSGEYDDMECREEEQMVATPGLEFGRWERGTWRAAQRLKKPGSTTPQLDPFITDFWETVSVEF